MTSSVRLRELAVRDELAARSRDVDAPRTYRAFGGVPRASARRTAPYQPGDVVLAQLGFTGVDAPRRVLISTIEPVWSAERFEYVDRYRGYVECRDGSFGRRLRRVLPGEIARGYADASLRGTPATTVTKRG